MSKEKSASSGPGFVSLLTLLFIGLKLTGHITWAWVWVLSPMLIAICLLLLIGLIAAVLQ